MRLVNWDLPTIAYYRCLWESVARSEEEASTEWGQFLEFTTGIDGATRIRERRPLARKLASLLSTQPPLLPPEISLRIAIAPDSFVARKRSTGEFPHDIAPPATLEQHEALWSNFRKGCKAYSKDGELQRLKPLLDALEALNEPDETAYLQLWQMARAWLLRERVNRVPEKLIRFLEGSENRARLYHEIEIPRKHGEPRIISIPARRLRWVQRSLLQLLTHLFPRHACATGFERGQDIVSHARRHVGKRLVYTLDIKDFFPSISRNRIFHMFRAFPFHASEEMARHLANLTTHNGSLPQGAPAIPILANLICRRLDSRLFKWARKNGYTYSRYADDLTFSTNARTIPEAHAQFVDQIIQEEGFAVHPDKKRLMPYTRRQIVTGLVVNEKVNVQRSFVRGLRALLHNIERHGWDSQVGRELLFPDGAVERAYNAGAMDRDAFLLHQKAQREKHLLTHRASAIPKANNEDALIRVVSGRIAFLGQVRGREDVTYVSLRSKLDQLLGRHSQHQARVLAGQTSYAQEPAPTLYKAQKALNYRAPDYWTLFANRLPGAVGGLIA